MARHTASRVLFVVLALSACKGDRRPPDARAPNVSSLQGEARQPDPALRDVVWAELQGSRAVPMDQLRVQVVDGRVILAGSVRTLAERAWAEELASRAFGVKGVRNELAVLAGPRPAGELQVAVEEALEADPRTRGRGLAVTTDGGRVRLLGAVPRGTDRFAATAVVERVRGVTALQNDIEIVPSTRPDAEIQAEIQQALAWERGLDGTPIVARVDGGLVRLNGSVPNVFAGNLAMASAWVDGVRGVDTSELQVVPKVDAPAPSVPPAVESLPEDPLPVIVPDRDITLALTRSFLQDPGLPANLWPPEVKGGVVTLRGGVDSAAAARAAEERARRIQGVVDVNNQLVVVPPAPLADEVIEAQAQSVLEEDADLGDMRLSVDVIGGVATLHGEADSTYHEYLARMLVSLQRGVTSVNSQIEVPVTPEANPTYQGIP